MRLNCFLCNPPCSLPIIDGKAICPRGRQVFSGLEAAEADDRTVNEQQGETDAEPSAPSCLEPSNSRVTFP